MELSSAMRPFWCMQRAKHLLHSAKGPGQSPGVLSLGMLSGAIDEERRCLVVTPTLRLGLEGFIRSGETHSLSSQRETGSDSWECFCERMGTLMVGKWN